MIGLWKLSRNISSSIDRTITTTQHKKKVGILRATTGTLSSGTAQPLTRSVIPRHERVVCLVARLEALCITILIHGQQVTPWLGALRLKGGRWNYKEIECETGKTMSRR